jgi:predicted outer membrane protein
MPRQVRDEILALLCASAILACAKRDAGVDSVRVPPTLTDANILAAMDQANMADSLMGEIAIAKGTHPDVRSFARVETREHPALRQRGVELATRLDVAPQIATGDTTAATDRALADSLRALPAGTAWDSFYLANAILHHENELAMLLTAHAETQSLEVAALIARDSSAVDAHRDRARSLLQRLAGLVMTSAR